MPKLFFNPHSQQISFFEARLTKNIEDGTHADHVAADATQGTTGEPKKQPGKDDPEVATTPKAEGTPPEEEVELDPEDVEKNREGLGILSTGVEASKEEAEQVAEQWGSFFEKNLADGVDFDPFKDECRDMADNYVKGTFNQVIEDVWELSQNADYGDEKPLFLRELTPALRSWGLQLWINRCGQSIEVDKKCGPETLRGCVVAIDYLLGKGQEPLETVETTVKHDFTDHQILVMELELEGQGFTLNLTHSTQTLNEMWAIGQEFGPEKGQSRALIVKEYLKRRKDKAQTVFTLANRGSPTEDEIKGIFILKAELEEQAGRAVDFTYATNQYIQNNPVEGQERTNDFVHFEGDNFDSSTLEHIEAILDYSVRAFPNDVNKLLAIALEFKGLWGTSVPLNSYLMGY